MSKVRLFLIGILALFALTLIGWNISGKESSQEKPQLNDEPTYQSQHTETVVFDPTGILQYKLIANAVKHYANQADSWFYQPVMTLYDRDAVPTWLIRANNAKLTKQRMLYLYGEVKVESLVATSQLKTVETNSAIINLANQDVTSDERVQLQGEGFRSSGLKMRGNLREKNATLIEQVKTTYETQQK